MHNPHNPQDSSRSHTSHHRPKSHRPKSHRPKSLSSTPYPPSQLSQTPQLQSSIASISSPLYLSSACLSSLFKPYLSLCPSLSRLQNILSNKLDKIHRAYYKLSEECQGLREKEKELKETLLKMRADKNREETDRFEVGYLRERHREMKEEIGGLYQELETAFAVVEEVKRVYSSKSTYAENVERRDAELRNKLRNCEIDRLRLEFNTILKNFQGEVQEYKFKDFKDTDKVDVVDENIKLRKKVHELQASLVLEQQTNHKLNEKIEALSLQLELKFTSQKDTKKHLATKSSRALFHLNEDESVPELSCSRPLTDRMSLMEKLSIKGLEQELMQVGPVEEGVQDSTIGTIFSKRRKTRDNIDTSESCQQESKGPFVQSSYGLVSSTQRQATFSGFGNSSKRLIASGRNLRSKAQLDSVLQREYPETGGSSRGVLKDLM